MNTLRPFWLSIAMAPESSSVPGRMRVAAIVLASIASLVLIGLSITNSPPMVVGEWRERRGYQMLSLRADGSARYNGKNCTWDDDRVSARLACGKDRYDMAVGYDRVVLSVGRGVEFTRAKVLLSRGD